MHVGHSTISELFDDAWDLGLISREHIFKKNGKKVISTIPYIKTASHGMGEYLGSRYWLNWSIIKKLQIYGVPESDTPNENGVPESDAPTKIGVPEISTPKTNIGVPEFGTPIKKIGVPETGTPVPESGTKVLIKGLTQGPNGLDGMDGGMDGAPAAPLSEPISENRDGQDANSQHHEKREEKTSRVYLTGSTVDSPSKLPRV
jgi:hypothetical protein